MSTTRPPRRSRGLGADFGFLAAPPPLARIVARAHLCCALLLRTELDTEPHSAEAGAILATLRGWLERAGASVELEPQESAALGAPRGALSAEQRERCGWLGEAAGVFGWALRRGPLPAPGAAADSPVIAEGLGFLSAEGESLGKRAQLRPRAEVLAALELLEVAGARLRRSLEPAATRGTARLSLARWRDPDYPWPEDMMRFSFVGDDLGLEGRAPEDLPLAQRFTAWRALLERRRAALWLLGAATHYSAVAVGEG
jgi:hypothetical protein